jgi:hypothetical protein
MERIVTYEDFKRVSKNWNPFLTKVDTIDEACDNINFPHEDYPEFVDNTKKALEETIHILNTRSLSESDLKFIHKICMENKEGLQLGKYRIGEVTVGENLIPPQPFLIPSLLMSIMPVGKEYQKTEEDIINWYKDFETIHPFEDGNGRVGGIVLAAMSKIITGKFIVSKKEYHYYIDILLNNIKKSKKSSKYDPMLAITYIDVKKAANKKFQKILEETNTMDKLNDIIIRTTNKEIGRTDYELILFLKELRQWNS